jgi:hypothetical protein
MQPEQIHEWVAQQLKKQTTGYIPVHLRLEPQVYESLVRHCRERGMSIDTAISNLITNTFKCSN